MLTGNAANQLVEKVLEKVSEKEGGGGERGERGKNEREIGGGSYMRANGEGETKNLAKRGR